MKILVADDSRVMRQIVIRTLRQAGYAGHDIVEAENGRDALEKVRSESPDLVLSDWNMPEMNGIDLLDALRSSGSSVPFGFVTSEGSPDMRARASAGGALFLIAKPFTPEAFDEALAPVLKGLSTVYVQTTYLPSTKEIRDLLTELLDREISVLPNPPLAPTPNNPCTVAVYVDDTLQVTSVIAFDLPLSARAGAAIGLVPQAGADAAIEERTLTDTLRENVYEVLNIAASLFNQDGATHVRLYDVHHAGMPVPGDVLARALTLGRREDLAVEVAGYGSGRLSVVLVA